ncbi:PREDICTED: uncharacterized protein LOC109487476 [Branchiostoma belcheri]|uniref:Uncharacterized protein LOC109487476 n=1 Tax=Branchiostoma belcheri TaxID=7741 RepID=A0A6P5A131_BRABE|nr:PREDICTED: uncharacterized protein LOC109487476 [Branchiostoma belcheri]
MFQLIRVCARVGGEPFYFVYVNVSSPIVIDLLLHNYWRQYPGDADYVSVWRITPLAHYDAFMATTLGIKDSEVLTQFRGGVHRGELYMLEIHVMDSDVSLSKLSEEWVKELQQTAEEREDPAKDNFIHPFKVVGKTRGVFLVSSASNAAMDRRLYTLPRFQAYSDAIEVWAFNVLPFSEYEQEIHYQPDHRLAPCPLVDSSRPRTAGSRSARTSGICRYGGVRNPLTGKCFCADTCSQEVDPVCGSDGEEYDNLCQLQVAACRQQKTIDALGQPPCGGMKYSGFLYMLEISVRPTAERSTLQIGRNIRDSFQQALQDPRDQLLYMMKVNGEPTFQT